jgi:uncharacterized protein (DUF433 family)
MRALHEVIVNPAQVRSGSPVFVGTRVPVRALLEHLDAGGDVDAFLADHPELDRATVQQALALGLEALIRDVPAEPRVTQRSLLPRFDAGGVILNAEDLVVDQVVRKRVRCPACRMLVFRSWPEGWDAHAGSRCRGLKGDGPEERKAEFKRRFGHLFRA